MDRAIGNSFRPLHSRRRLVAAVLAAGLAGLGASPAAAQFSPKLAPSIMGPVVTNQCTGGRCSKRSAPTQRSDSTQKQRAQATCVNARRMAGKPGADPRLPQLLEMCDRAGY